MRTYGKDVESKFYFGRCFSSQYQTKFNANLNPKEVPEVCTNKQDQMGGNIIFLPCSRHLDCDSTFSIIVSALNRMFVASKISVTEW